MKINGNEYLTTGDKIKANYWDQLCSDCNKTKIITVSRVTKLYAFASDGRKIYKFRRAVNGGLKQVGAYRQPFATNGVRFSLPVCLRKKA